MDGSFTSEPNQVLWCSFLIDSELRFSYIQLTHKRVFAKKTCDMKVLLCLYYATKARIYIFEERKILERKRLDR